jgi:hypothetical protein
LAADPSGSPGRDELHPVAPPLARTRGTPALLRRGGRFALAALAIFAISTVQWNPVFPLTARLGLGVLVHPLLVREAAFPFWIVLALAIVTAGSQPSTWRPRSRTVTIGLVVACVLVFASVPFRLDIPPVRLPASQDRFGPWQTVWDGKRFREAAEYSSLFVGADVSALDIPLRRMPGLQGHRLTVVDRDP